MKKGGKAELQKHLRLKRTVAPHQSSLATNGAGLGVQQSSRAVW